MHVKPYAIRYIEEQYVDAFFQKGELLLSSFMHFCRLPNIDRRDEDEGEIAYYGEPINMIGTVSNRYLVLSSSMSMNENARVNQKCGILIKDIEGFCKGVATSIEDTGLMVRRVFFGPCNYFSRDMSFKNISNSSNDAMSLLRERFCLEDLLFSKEPVFSFENELRFVFELDRDLSYGKDRVLVNVSDEVVSACSKIVF